MQSVSVPVFQLTGAWRRTRRPDPVSHGQARLELDSAEPDALAQARRDPGATDRRDDTDVTSRRVTECYAVEPGRSSASPRGGQIQNEAVRDRVKAVGV